jgi:hypothetical protein
MLAVFFQPDAIPPLTWDEGWTFALARNWVENGHYGQLLQGEPAPTGFSAALPVSAPIALSFRLFGAGIWQGRLPGVLMTCAALGLLFYLSRELFNEPVAFGALGVLLLMSGSEQLNVLIVGRQALGEMPMLFYLLAAYSLFLLSLNRSALFILPAILCFGIAINTKAQVLPFWLVSMLAPLLLAVYRRWWRAAALFAFAIPASYYTAQQLIYRLLDFTVQQPVLANPAVEGLYTITGLVVDWYARQLALRVALSVGLPTLLGLGAAAWGTLRNIRSPENQPGPELIRLSLLGLAGSWFAWYVLLGMYWPRYLFPAVFIASPFTAALLYKLTAGFRFRDAFRSATDSLLRRNRSRPRWGALLACLLVVMTVPLTILVYLMTYLVLPNASVVQAAEYLNRHAPQGSLVESYDSQVFFLMDQPYHYPPASVHVQVDRRAYLGQDVPIDYDPLEANPDYLVIGPYGRKYQIYQPVLDAGHFRLAASFPDYEIYARVGP